MDSWDTVDNNIPLEGKCWRSLSLSLGFLVDDRIKDTEVYGNSCNCPCAWLYLTSR